MKMFIDLGITLGLKYRWHATTEVNKVDKLIHDKLLLIIIIDTMENYDYDLAYI